MWARKVKVNMTFQLFPFIDNFFLRVDKLAEVALEIFLSKNSWVRSDIVSRWLWEELNGSFIWIN